VGNVTRPQLAVYVAAAIAIALLGARYLHGQGSSTSARSGGSGGSAAGAPGGRGPSGVRVVGSEGGAAVVDVSGAVRRPGVYRLESGARVDDAVRRAGGATRRADLTGVNLAAKVEDGRQYVVPVRGASAGGQVAGAGGDPAGSGGGAVTPAGPLNLNTATAEQLDQLDGVGPATARKIIAYRTQKGGFRSVEELDQVPGIGPARMAALRDVVRV
jgi:competence protein ComEA